MNRRRSSRKRRVSKRRRSRGGGPKKYEEGTLVGSGGDARMMDERCGECFYPRSHDKDCGSPQQWEQKPDGTWETWMGEPIGVVAAMEPEQVHGSYKMVGSTYTLPSHILDPSGKLVRRSTQPAPPPAVVGGPEAAMEPPPATMGPGVGDCVCGNTELFCSMTGKFCVGKEQRRKRASAQVFEVKAAAAARARGRSAKGVSPRRQSGKKSGMTIPTCNQPGCGKESTWDGQPCDDCVLKTKEASAIYQASAADRLAEEAAGRATAHQQVQAQEEAYQAATTRFHEGWDPVGQARASSGRYAGPRSAATPGFEVGPTIGAGQRDR